MPDPDYAGWQADPSALLAFLQTNIIATGLLPNSQQPGVPEYLYLDKKDTPVIQDGKEVGKVWYLKASDKNTTNTALFSYICDYQKNDTKFVMLGDRAKFCFTITMNGCTFGIGAPNSSGDVIVSHCNRASDSNQAVTQRDITRGGHKNANVTLLEPSMYRPVAQMTCTTFGLRIGSTWKFYFQSYRPSGGQFLFFGTMPIETQSLTK